MGTLQKWLMATAGLGALYMVVSNPQGVAAAGKALKDVVGGTVTQISTGGKAGG